MRFRKKNIRGHSNSTYAQRGGEGVSEKAKKNEQYFMVGGGSNQSKRSFSYFFILTLYMERCAALIIMYIAILFCV